jgi:hypothetical protein
MVAAIGAGDAFANGRDFAAWLEYFRTIPLPDIHEPWPMPAVDGTPNEDEEGLEIPDLGAHGRRRFAPGSAIGSRTTGPSSRSPHLTKLALLPKTQNPTYSQKDDRALADFVWAANQVVQGANLSYSQKVLGQSCLSGRGTAR